MLRLAKSTGIGYAVVSMTDTTRVIFLDVVPIASAMIFAMRLMVRSAYLEAYIIRWLLR